MSESKNKIAAQLLKAEMLGDRAKVEILKKQLSNMDDESSASKEMYQKRVQPREKTVSSHKRPKDQRVKRFVDTNPSLKSMFIEEKGISARDEAKMYVKTSLKFAHDDMETKHFSQEIDDSQVILNRRKRHKVGPSSAAESDSERSNDKAVQDDRSCERCFVRCPRHLVIDKTDNVFICLMDSKPFIADMNTVSNIVIRNRDHPSPSLVSSSDKCKQEVDGLINNLKICWASRGFRLIAMETYFKTRRPQSGEVVSCGQHFLIHCIPIKDKHYDRARMGFKQALLDTGQEWSLNKKLITSDGRKIYRCLPDGLSYFWISFDGTTNGFGHIVEDERNFSRYFGFEVLSDLFTKEFSMARLNQREDYKALFERSRSLKLIYFTNDDADKDKD